MIASVLPTPTPIFLLFESDFFLPWPLGLFLSGPGSIGTCNVGVTAAFSSKVNGAGIIPDSKRTVGGSTALGL